MKGVRGMEFNVGDRVVVKNNGCSFTAYRGFFKENGLEQWGGCYAEHERIPQNEEYTIVATGKHRHINRYGTLYVLQGHDGKIYIGSNDREYMELVKEGERGMKYKVGDKVKVRSDLVDGEQYGESDTFNDHMQELSGKTATISTVCPNHYHLAEDGHFLKYDWTGEMFEGLAKEESKMIYASELMELARKEPEKYEGKRYKVEGEIQLRMGNHPDKREVVVENGILLLDGGCTTFITQNTQLEEIKPEPKPVGFMEAMNSGKHVTSEDRSIQSCTPEYLLENHRFTLSQINGKWFIED
jgi:hypothetical protein